MSNSSLGHRPGDGDVIHVSMIEEIMRHFLSQQVRAVELRRDEALRAIGNHPDPVGLIFKQLANCTIESQHVLVQSSDLLQTMLEELVFELRCDAEAKNELLCQTRDRFDLSQSIPPQVEPVSASDIVFIDLTKAGPLCRLCEESLEGSRATVYELCGCHLLQNIAMTDETRKLWTSILQRLFKICTTIWKPNMPVLPSGMLC
ncbi:hypothetical protein F4824DRAFT_504284 [Ustulina deusta]|nr:hypothetical protein F4824DRAFT_504284 [Ustulina deusta]